MGSFFHYASRFVDKGSIFGIYQIVPLSASFILAYFFADTGPSYLAFWFQVIFLTLLLFFLFFGLVWMTTAVFCIWYANRLDPVSK